MHTHPPPALSLPLTCCDDGLHALCCSLDNAPRECQRCCAVALPPGDLSGGRRKGEGEFRTTRYTLATPRPATQCALTGGDVGQPQSIQSLRQAGCRSRQVQAKDGGGGAGVGTRLAGLGCNRQLCYAPHRLYCWRAARPCLHPRPGPRQTRIVHQWQSGEG